MASPQEITSIRNIRNLNPENQIDPNIVQIIPDRVQLVHRRAPGGTTSGRRAEAEAKERLKHIDSMAKTKERLKEVLESRRAMKDKVGNSGDGESKEEIIFQENQEEHEVGNSGDEESKEEIIFQENPKKKKKKKKKKN